ncbi:MAG: glycosyltransferase [Lyngbya sp. HA4199-MV5]|jgi:glycosyltransferase involved in cell wall biosynthesis|nr:glycosyltransferase [Lyngbya sp. HA4199-MV5]
MFKQAKLFVLPVLSLKLSANGEYLLPQKFVDGMIKYAELWSGSVKAFMQVASPSKKYAVLDEKAFQASELPFEIEIVSYNTLTAQILSPASVVLASADYQQNHISQLCRSANVPCVYIAEYSLKTRKQTVAATVKNPLLRLRRTWWEISQERKQRRAIALAEGVQCNGTPTYRAYQAINSKPLLFFDTRMSQDLLANEADIEQRYQHLLNLNNPLRLAFSGRFVAEKGVDQVLDVAVELKRLGVAFQLFLCGDGELKHVLQQRIQREGLHDRVTLIGVLAFQQELVPFMKQQVDLFVCCHRQGDPSCTYLETLACGVPIVSYSNEAFVGIERQSQTGWVVPMNQPTLLAQKIAQLDGDRAALQAMALRSLAFARSHTFEKTFAHRVEHLEKVALAGTGATPLDSSKLGITIMGSMQ